MTHLRPTEPYPSPIRSLSLGEMVDLFLSHASGEASEGFLRQILPLGTLDPGEFVRMLTQESERRSDEIARRYRSELGGQAESTKVPPSGLTSNADESVSPGTEGTRISPSPEAKSSDECSALAGIPEAFRDAKFSVESFGCDGGSYYAVTVGRGSREAVVADTLNCDSIFSPEDQRAFAELLSKAPRVAAENVRLKSENAELRAKAARLDREHTLIACDGCGKGVRARDTRGYMCIDCLARKAGQTTGETE